VIVLDTDVFTIVQRESGEDYARLSARLDGVHPDPVCVTDLTFEEQMRGWLAWIAGAKSLEKQVFGYERLRGLLEDYQPWPMLPFDDQAAVTFQQLKDGKVRIGTTDLKIAAVALSRDALLLTRNLRDFRKVPDLRVEDWTLP
jgi:tRNA(fMet)-specific endonuclease VapC